MKSEDGLRKVERLLAVQYGANPPNLDGEDLECNDLADVEYWVQVYTDLVEFTRGLMETDSSGPSPAGGQRPSERTALLLQAQVQDLHLSYWRDRLTRLRAELGSEPRRAGETAGASGSHAAGAIRVLLIEDDTEFAEMYRLRLEADEYAVEWARNGCEGLRLVHAWEPDLVFLDVRMPEMDGLELLRALRSDPATASVPVVMLTNYDDDGMRREAEGLGILEWRLKVDTTPSGIATWMERWSSTLAEESRTS